MFPLLNYICLVILIILFFCIALDLIPILKDWLGRIKIGQYESIDQWRESITAINAKWLLITPKIKVNDHNRWIILDLLKGNYSNASIQNWQEASLLLGINESLKYKNEEVLKQKRDLFLQKTLTSDGSWINKPHNIDGAILAYALLQTSSDTSDSCKIAMDEMWDIIQQNIGEDGTVMYRKSMKNYRYVDTIGFICPFLISYGVKYDKEECLELAMKQIRSYSEYGILQEHFIPGHAYNIHSKYPLGLYGWGRGVAWFALGVIDSWNALPQHSPYKNELQHMIERLTQTIISLQQKNGNWNWTVTREESRADSSTTATLVWFLLNAAKIPHFSTKCKIAIDSAIQYLMNSTRRNGEIDFSQGDTKDIGVYSNQFHIMPFTQGLCVRSINYYLYYRVINEGKNTERRKGEIENNSIYANI